MKITFNETINSLYDELNTKINYYDIKSGSEIFYKNKLVKIAGRGRPRREVASLFGEMKKLLFPSSKIPSPINKNVIIKAKKTRRKSKPIDLPLLVKNGFATIELVDGLYGIKLNDNILPNLIDLFLHTVKGNDKRKQVSRTGRISNFPEEISEGLCCLKLNKLLYYKKDVSNKSDITFDCFDANATYQVKGSCSTGPSSFSPNANYDMVLYFKFNMDTTQYSIYEIDKCDIDNIKVNSLQSIQDQRKTGLRPRTSLDKYIQDKNIVPIFSDYLIKDYNKTIMSKQVLDIEYSV